MNGASSSTFRLAAAAAAAAAALPSPRTSRRCLALLQSFTRTRSLVKGKLLHGHIIATGFLSPLSRDSLRQPLLLNLASMYALCGNIFTARLLFDQITRKGRTVFSYNVIVRGYLQEGLPLDAVHLFEEMRVLNRRPDKFTFTFVIKACGDLFWRRMGGGVHCLALVMGFESDGYVRNSLMGMYLNCGSVENACMVFDGMCGCNRTVVSWNTMISGLFQKGLALEALKIYDQMVNQGVQVDRATVVSVLPACAHLKDLSRGRQIHRVIDEEGIGGHVAVKNALIDMYSKCGCLKEACLLFEDKACQNDIVSWTAMIGGYILNGSPGEALALSCKMILSGIKPNAVTMVSLLSACTSSSSMKYGKCIHGLCIRLRHEYEIFVETALIDMYGKCGSMRLSFSAFMGGSRRTETWNALISNYAHNKLPIDAVKSFKQMHSEATRPDLATIISVLPAYSNLADFNQARNVHCYLTRVGFHPHIEVTTAMIDVYAKTGALEAARKLFDGLLVRDIVSWSAIIAGYGMHGHARAAILLFKQMEASGVEPNEVTFTSMLYSCSHAGLVDEGLYFFWRMLESADMEPEAEHYACIVDLLGRAGRLDEAYGLIRAIPSDPNHAVWGALLGACVIHENVELGEKAAAHLFNLEPENTGNYILLGNIYSAVGRWKDAENIRCLVNCRGLKKEPGCSMPELPNPRPYGFRNQLPATKELHGSV